MKKYFSLIIVPHDNANMRNYRFSYLLAYIFAGLVAISIISMAVFVGTYGKVLVAAHRSRDLARENKTLMARNAQIDSLRTEFKPLP